VSIHANCGGTHTARRAPAIRAEWSEDRGEDGYFIIIADWNGREWEFSERDSWEVSWFPIPPNRERIAKADQLADAKPPVPGRAA
jgi:hypothetical protein